MSEQDNNYNQLKDYIYVLRSIYADDGGIEEHIRKPVSVIIDALIAKTLEIESKK